MAARTGTKKRRPSRLAPRRSSPAGSPCAPAVAGRATCTSSTACTTVTEVACPVLAIAAQIPSREIGSGYFQETHPEQLFTDCSHYCELVSQPEQMPRVLEHRHANRDRESAAWRWSCCPATSPSASAAFQPVGGTGRSRREHACRPTGRIRRRAAACSTRAKEGHDPRRGRLRGCPRRAHRPRRTLEGPDRPRDARQGVHRVRQPVRRRHDGAAGLLVGVPRDDGLRCAADARDRLPVSAVLSAERKVIQVDLRGEQIGRRTRVDLGLVGDVKETLACAHAVARRPERIGPIWTDRLATMHAGPRGARRARNRGAGAKPIHPQYVARLVERACRGRCRVHVRRRHADDVGGSLSAHERQAAAAGVVHARVDGERPAAGDRCAAGVCRAGRWSACQGTAAGDAARRSADVAAARACR